MRQRLSAGERQDASPGEFRRQAIEFSIDALEIAFPAVGRDEAEAAFLIARVRDAQDALDPSALLVTLGAIHFAALQQFPQPLAAYFPRQKLELPFQGRVAGLHRRAPLSR
ncbi:MAG: hypothetical protein AAB268_04020 [Elusimicrobiota bacterium]